MTFYFLLVTNSGSNHILLRFSVAHCSIGTIEHYVHNSRQPAYVLLLDASKAFDRVCYNELFTMLIERNVSPFIIRFLLFMLTNQTMRVKWKDSLSDHFSIGNGVRQGAVLSPLLFTLVYRYVVYKVTSSRLRLPCRSNICRILWICR